MGLSEWLELVLVVMSYNDKGWEPIFCYLSPQTATRCLPSGYYINPFGTYKQILASENVTESVRDLWLKHLCFAVTYLACASSKVFENYFIYEFLCSVII